jgi:hypothetical protein
MTISLSVLTSVTIVCAGLYSVSAQTPVGKSVDLGADLGSYKSVYRSYDPSQPGSYPSYSAFRRPAELYSATRPLLSLQGSNRIQAAQESAITDHGHLSKTLHPLSFAFAKSTPTGLAAALSLPDPMVVAKSTPLLVHGAPIHRKGSIVRQFRSTVPPAPSSRPARRSGLRSIQ